MNIDDLHQDIADMETEDGDFDHNNFNNQQEYEDMCEIAEAYEEDFETCIELIEKFRNKYGYKINIL